MLKKLIIILPLLGLGFGGYWLNKRVNANSGEIFPNPFTLPRGPEKIAIESPILIIGDRMADRFGLFKETMALEISSGLSKPIRIEVLAGKNDGIHRTIYKLDNIEKWPKVMIYTGGSVELIEERFYANQIPTIRTNIARYKDDRWRTLLMLWPDFSYFLYEPIKQIPLTETPKIIENQENEQDYQARLELSYQMYEILLNIFVEKARDQNQFLILMTVPINLDIEPKKTCSVSYSPEVKKEIEEIKRLIKNNDYKSAYPRSLDLSLATFANAEVFWLHGLTSKKVGRFAEAKDSLHKAAAFDCLSWRSNQVTNNIIRKVAQEQKIALYDFAAIIEEDWNTNTTFFDEINPQNLYYEKAAQDLGLLIKKVLKL